MERADKSKRLEELRLELERLESEVALEKAAEWPPKGYYTAYHAMAGAFLGMLGAMASLLFNVIGSLLVGKDPLQIVRVYLTFPLGGQALDQAEDLAVAIGVCLYIGTGMVLGIPIQLILSRYFGKASFVKQLLLVTVIGLGLWVINFYAILSWLQPALFGGSWILDQIPPWVAALTHLVFAWTMLLMYPLGRFRPYGISNSEGKS
ncbi:MAG: hypothetical protein RL885_16830 [Planctomycetota bacterium]